MQKYFAFQLFKKNFADFLTPVFLLGTIQMSPQDQNGQIFPSLWGSHKDNKNNFFYPLTVFIHYLSVIDIDQQQLYNLRPSVYPLQITTVCSSLVQPMNCAVYNRTMFQFQVSNQNSSVQKNPDKESQPFLICTDLLNFIS